jgi:stage III sporulation protein AE
MIKKVVIMMILFINLFTYNAFAEDFDFKQQLEISGASELIENAPSGVKIEDEKTFLNFKISDIFTTLENAIKNEITSPLKNFALIVGMILLFALIRTFSTSFNQGEFSKTFELVIALSICVAILVPITEVIKSSTEVITQCNNFTTSFLPVFSSVVVASGKPLSATAYGSIMIGFIHIVTSISSTVLLPFLRIYLAFNVVGSINNQINVDGLSETIRNTILWFIGISLTIFIGLLTIQSIVANATDTIGTRTAKFAVSSVPIVGGAISEAFNSIQGCLSLLKASVGTFGIICFISIFLPIIIKIILLLLTVNISCAISNLFKLDTISKILKASNNTLVILLSIIFCILVFLIVATTILITVGGGS